MKNWRMLSTLGAAVVCAAALAAAASADVGQISVATTPGSVTVTGTEQSGSGGQCGRVGADLFDAQGQYLGRFLEDSIDSDPQGFSFTFDGLEPNQGYIVGVWDDCEGGDLPCNAPVAHAYYGCVTATTVDSSTAGTSVDSSTAGTGVASASVPRPADRFGYCSSLGDTWQDGTPIMPGTFLNLLLGQPDTDKHYTGAVPAFYVEGVGITCSLTPQQAALAASSTKKAGGGGDVTPVGFYPYIAE